MPIADRIYVLGLVMGIKVPIVIATAKMFDAYCIAIGCVPELLANESTSVVAASLGWQYSRSSWLFLTVDGHNVLYANSLLNTPWLRDCARALKTRFQHLSAVSTSLITRQCHRQRMRYVPVGASWQPSERICRCCHQMRSPFNCTFSIACRLLACSTALPFFINRDLISLSLDISQNYPCIPSRLPSTACLRASLNHRR